MRPIAAIVIFAYSLVWIHQAGHGELATGLDQRTHIHAAPASLFEFDHSHASVHDHDHDHHDHDHHAGHTHDAADRCAGSHDHHHYSHEHFSLVSLAPSGKQTAKAVHAPAALPAKVADAEWTFHRSSHFAASRADVASAPKYLVYLSLRI